MSLLNRCYRTFWDWQHLLHHATAMPGQSVVGIVDVPHILGTPQSLGHSAGTRPKQEEKISLYLSDLKSLNDGYISFFFYYQSLGITLVESTYSPQRQASPPMTSFFCASVPVLKCVTSSENAAKSKAQEMCDCHWLLGSLCSFNRLTRMCTGVIPVNISNP